MLGSSQKPTAVLRYGLKRMGKDQVTKNMPKVMAQERSASDTPTATTTITRPLWLTFICPCVLERQRKACSGPDLSHVPVGWFPGVETDNKCPFPTTLHVVGASPNPKADQMTESPLTTQAEWAGEMVFSFTTSFPCVHTLSFPCLSSPPSLPFPDTPFSLGHWHSW